MGVAPNSIPIPTPTPTPNPNSIIAILFRFNGTISAWDETLAGH